MPTSDVQGVEGFSSGDALFLCSSMLFRSIIYTREQSAAGAAGLVAGDSVQQLVMPSTDPDMLVMPGSSHMHLLQLRSLPAAASSLAGCADTTASLSHLKRVSRVHKDAKGSRSPAEVNAAGLTAAAEQLPCLQIGRLALRRPLKLAVAAVCCNTSPQQLALDVHLRIGHSAELLAGL